MESVEYATWASDIRDEVKLIQSWATLQSGAGAPAVGLRKYFFADVVAVRAQFPNDGKGRWDGFYMKKDEFMYLPADVDAALASLRQERDHWHDVATHCTEAYEESEARGDAADAALGALRARLHQTVTKMRAYNDSHAFLVHQWADELERANEP
jgi:hypothetical protein